MPFEVVLHRPEIPNNTGNIGRTCMAVGAGLHLIHPLGFSLAERRLRRAGLDYWPRLNPAQHPDWATYHAATHGARRWLLTTKAARSALDAPYTPGDHLVFGSETTGLPDDLLAAHPDRCLALPMVPGERSLNVATAVCAVLYLAIAKAVADGAVGLDGPRLTHPNRQSFCSPDRET